MCSSCRIFKSTRWLPLFMLLAALVHPSSQALADACQASGSLLMGTTAGTSCTLLGGGAYDVAVQINNTSSVTVNGIPTAPSVSAKVVAGSTVTVTLPTGDSFVSVGANGCVTGPNPPIASCTGSTGPCTAPPVGVCNTVNILTNADIVLVAGATNVPIATIRALSKTPAAAGCQAYTVTGNAPFGSIATTDPICTPQVVGGASGSTPYTQVQCVTPEVCPIGTECNLAACVNNTCGFAPVGATTHCGAANTECSSNSCDGAGSCVTTPTAKTTHCGAANTECSSNSCDGSGSCVTTNTPSTTHCGATDTSCQTNSCNGQGACTTTNQPDTTSCNADLCQSCSAGVCGTTNICVAEACRTPGYWAQHAGLEKTCATNQTSLVIASALGGSITVCGQTINPFSGAGNTGVDHQTAPIEALCQPNGGDFRSQVVFQLTAAILNCAANNPANVGCVGDPLFGPIVAACLAGNACAPTTPATKADQAACVSALDCLNNGGHISALGGACTFNADNCHNRSFANFPDSCAGSQDACKAAAKNACTIFGGCSFNP